MPLKAMSGDRVTWFLLLILWYLSLLHCLLKEKQIWHITNLWRDFIYVCMNASLIVAAHYYETRSTRACALGVQMGGAVKHLASDIGVLNPKPKKKG